MSAIQGARPSDDAKWKRLLLAMCAMALILQIFGVAVIFGAGGRPWLGLWNSSIAPTERPFVVAFHQPVRGGAADRAGIRNDDTLDLREQSLAGRVAALYLPTAARPLSISIHRGSRRFSVRVLFDSVWEVQAQLNLPPELVAAITNLWFLGCALLIALRASSLRSGRIWALILLLWAFPLDVTTPNPVVTLLYVWFIHVAATAALLLFVYLASGFGVRYGWRRILEWGVCGAALLPLIPMILWPVGALTLRFDPWPYAQGTFLNFAFNVVAVALPVTAIAAVASTPSSERARSAWLLLPLPLSIGIATLIATWSSKITSWPLQEAWTLVSTLFGLLGAAIVAYALVKRRVLDVAFILNRTIVVAIVSLLVVAAFALLEWLLGRMITGVSHATGVVANAALAVVIGVSLGYIHRGVDKFVDATLFRKRHEDEQALLHFSKEAAYVTKAESLLDQAIGQVARHTDARNAAILLNQRSSYETVRSFGDGLPLRVDENDGVILALKTWNTPLDPHRYATALEGALALPMVARGRLLGVLFLGERAGGEAYAPDEVAALSAFAHGVGSAIGALSAESADSIAALRESIASMGDSITESLANAMQALPGSIAAELRDKPSPSAPSAND